MRTFAEIRRLAGRTATIGTVRSNGVNRRRTVPSRSSAANSHAGACAIPRCSRTPILICSISLVLKTPVGIMRFALGPYPILHGCGEPRSTKTTAGKRRRSSGDCGMPYRMTYCGVATRMIIVWANFLDDQAGIRKITRMDSQIEAIFDDRCRAFGPSHLNRHVGICGKERGKLRNHMEPGKRRRNG